MKQLFKIFILLALIHSGSFMTAEKASAQAAVSFQVFYDNLSPYGNWVQSPQYGYVWVPNVAPGFSPYCTNGHWVYTDIGWTWVSDYSWGWAPFHYGCWYSDPIYGSMWVPGNEWGPGWVTWRQSDGYYGWACIGPNGYSVPDNRWTFVRSGDFGKTNINYVSRSGNTAIIHNSTIINNARVAGPDRAQVQKRTGAPVTAVAIKESAKPGQNLSNNQLQLYRPHVQNTAGGQKPAPAKVANMKDLKPIAQRTTTAQTKTGNASANAQPAKKQQATAQKSAQSTPVKSQTTAQRKDQPAKQQAASPQRASQPAKDQTAQAHKSQPTAKQKQPAQRKDQAAKQQASPPQHDAQPVKPQAQPQQNNKPAEQKPAEQPAEQNKQQPEEHQSQPKPEGQPIKQEPPQQHNAEPEKQQEEPPHQDNPPENKDEGKPR